MHVVVTFDLFYAVSCGSRLVFLLSILKSLFEREISQKVMSRFPTTMQLQFLVFSDNMIRCEIGCLNNTNGFLDLFDLSFVGQFFKLFQEKLLAQMLSFKYSSLLTGSFCRLWFSSQLVMR